MIKGRGEEFPVPRGMLGFTQCHLRAEGKKHRGFMLPHFGFVLVFLHNDEQQQSARGDLVCGKPELYRCPHPGSFQVSRRNLSKIKTV